MINLTTINKLIKKCNENELESLTEYVDAIVLCFKIEPPLANEFKAVCERMQHLDSEVVKKYLEKIMHFYEKKKYDYIRRYNQLTAIAIAQRINELKKN